MKTTEITASNNKTKSDSNEPNMQLASAGICWHFFNCDISVHWLFGALWESCCHFSGACRDSLRLKTQTSSNQC